MKCKYRSLKPKILRNKKIKIKNKQLIHESAGAVNKNVNERSGCNVFMNNRCHIPSPFEFLFYLKYVITKHSPCQ